MWSPQCLPPPPLRDILFVNFIGKLKRKENEPGPNLHNQHSFSSWSNFKKIARKSTRKHIHSTLKGLKSAQANLPESKTQPIYSLRVDTMTSTFHNALNLGKWALQAQTCKMLILVRVLKEIYFISKWSHS